jgi:Arabinose-binding domain of AraC transcription regulator, N-term
MRAIEYQRPRRNSAPYYERVGGLVVIPGVLQEMGADPTVILPRAGVETNALDDVETRIPYATTGRLFHECALAMGCPHFGLLAYQRVRLSHLGLPGELVRYSATLRTGLQTFVEYQHLNNQGVATFLLEDKGIASLGCAVYQKNAEFIDHIYDAFLAVACNIMRELWGSGWAPRKFCFLGRSLLTSALIADSSALPADSTGTGRRYSFQPLCSTGRCRKPILSGSEDWNSRLRQSAKVNSFLG